MIEKIDIYDEMGFPISDPYVEEGYDAGGFPICRAPVIRNFKFSQKEGKRNE